MEAGGSCLKNKQIDIKSTGNRFLLERKTVDFKGSFRYESTA